MRCMTGITLTSLPSHYVQSRSVAHLASDPLRTGSCLLSDYHFQTNLDFMWLTCFTPYQNVTCIKVKYALKNVYCYKISGGHITWW